MYIIPHPQKIEIFEEKIKADSFCIESDNEEIFKFFRGNGNFRIRFENDSLLGKECYTISITSKEIKVRYGDLEAAYRAYTTLKQIIAQSENGEIPCLEIEDYPSIKNRGYMLDISRGRIPTLKHLKNIVDMLSDLKYNQLQLYMDSFVYEYKNFPDYTKDTDPLTRDEILELSAYCKEKFISLVPNQNGFGHMGAWTEKKELSHLAITGFDGKPSNTLNPLLDGSIELLDKIYDGFFDSFLTDIVNIGMDEPFELGINETKEICEKEGVGKVYTDYLKKVCNLISDKYNKIPMFWDDIVFKHEDQIDNIPQNVIFMQWGYETEHHFNRNCRKLREKGLRFYVCPGTSMWGSYIGRTNNAIVNMSIAAECGNYYGAEGFLLTEWGDNGHPQFTSTALFPLTYGGAVSWNSGDHNVELGYAERRKRICDCKKYVDKYLYDCQGDTSLCDIVYRMGNYYLIEDSLQFNQTELNFYLNNPNDLSKEKIEGFKRVREYMVSLRSELKSVDANETVIREVRTNCDMVILVASKFAGIEMDYKKEFDALKTEFEELWLMKNHRNGINICLSKIESALGLAQSK